MYIIYFCYIFFVIYICYVFFCYMFLLYIFLFYVFVFFVFCFFCFLILFLFCFFCFCFVFCCFFVVFLICVCVCGVMACVRVYGMAWRRCKTCKWRCTSLGRSKNRQRLGSSRSRCNCCLFVASAVRQHNHMGTDGRTDGGGGGVAARASVCAQQLFRLPSNTAGSFALKLLSLSLLRVCC